MEIALSPSAKVALSGDAASIRRYAEGCESLPAVKIEIRRALASFKYIGHCVLAERVRGCILEAQGRLEAIDEGVC